MSPPNKRNRPGGRLSNQSLGGASIQLEVYRGGGTRPDVLAADAALALPRMSLRDLAIALRLAPAAMSDIEFGTFRFQCPNHDDKAWSAYESELDPCLWGCHVCKKDGTRWQLERLVVENADALRRIAEWIAETA